MTTSARTYTTPRDSIALSLLIVIPSPWAALGEMMAEQRGFFDLDDRYAALSKAGDPLERLAAVIDFEIFRAELDAALRRSDGAKGGRPPMDAVLMFKVLVLQVST